MESKEEKIRVKEYLKGRVLIPAVKVVSKSSGKRIRQTFCAISSTRQDNKARSKALNMSNKKYKKYIKKRRRDAV